MFSNKVGIYDSEQSKVVENKKKHFGGSMHTHAVYTPSGNAHFLLYIIIMPFNNDVSKMSFVSFIKQNKL